MRGGSTSNEVQVQRNNVPAQQPEQAQHHSYHNHIHQYLSRSILRRHGSASTFATRMSLPVTRYLPKHVRWAGHDKSPTPTTIWPESLVSLPDQDTPRSPSPIRPVLVHEIPSRPRQRSAEDKSSDEKSYVSKWSSDETDTAMPLPIQNIRPRDSLSTLRRHFRSLHCRSGVDGSMGDL